MNKAQIGLALSLVVLTLPCAQAESDPKDIPDAYYEQYDIVTPNAYPGPTAEDITPGSSAADTPDCPDDLVSAADEDIFSESGRGTSRVHKVKCNPPKPQDYGDP